jgi:hypothetical protein
MKKILIITLILATAFLVGFWLGMDSGRKTFLRMDANDRKNLNDGFSLASSNAIGRIESIGLCWAERTNNLVRIFVPGKLGRTILEIDTNSNFISGQSFSGP